MKLSVLIPAAILLNGLVGFSKPLPNAESLSMQSRTVEEPRGDDATVDLAFLSPGWEWRTKPESTDVVEARNKEEIDETYTHNNWLRVKPDARDIMEARGDDATIDTFYSHPAWLRVKPEARDIVEVRGDDATIDSIYLNPSWVRVKSPENVDSV